MIQIVQIRTFSSLSAIVLFLATCALAEGSSSSPQIFRMVEGEWSSCNPINSTQTCYRSREAVCVRTTDNSTAPWYYCTDIGLERPHTLEGCASCAQDCAVSEWTDWTLCNCTAGFFRSRRREIVLPPRNGGKECPNLLERGKCATCFQNRPFDVLPRSHTWRTGEWGVCSTLDSTADCGHGMQTRSVQCIDTEERVVNSTLCRLEVEAYAHVVPPSTTKLCDIPCTCQVGAWSDWTVCTANCSTTPPSGYQKRTRDIVRHATLGGACSQALEETRTCTLNINTCPTYSWESSGWSLCKPQDSEATCGVGHTTRFAYCMEETRDGVSTLVDSSLCDNSRRPTTLELCDISCQQDCVVGPWFDWSECPKACMQTYSNRTRDVVLPLFAGGAACPHLIEHRACPVLPCVSWVPQPYQPCFTTPGNCGVGTRTREIECQDYNGNVLRNSRCSSLPDPSNFENCYKPCSDNCVVSEWSDWSECSEMCGGIIGTQSRQRNFAALGTSCPYTDADLTETRNCSNPQPCVEELYYIIEDPWGLCREEEDTSQSSGVPGTLLQFTDSGSSTRCGVGLQNRTAVCMRGDNAIPPEECPIGYEPLLKRPCNLPCTSECQYTEWTAYSECSVMCGSGTKTRSRWLLQFADSTSSDSDCMVDSDGFQSNTISCENPACPTGPEYVWYITNYGDCVLFPSILSQHSQPPQLTGSLCGYGYQNRSVTCRHNSTGRLVEDELCLQTGKDRPSEVRQCEVVCQDRCIVTEWSNYSRCSAENDQTRTREIISCSRFDDWEWCCPELSSLELTETVACEHPDLTEYRWTPTSIYGACIIDDPDQSCGNGMEYVSYSCLDGQGNRVSEDFCPSLSTIDPPPKRSCAIQCETNCELSPWTDWGACSTTCGRGTRMRTRFIRRNPEEFGRPCGSLMETDVCENNAQCPYAEYVPGPFSGCIPADSNSTCGTGTQTRQAICLVDGQTATTQECQNLGAAVTFELSRGCELPCAGECVVSEWGEWGPCSTDCLPGSCQQDRHRQILRTSSNCPMTVEYRHCQPEAPHYAWRAQNWTNCTLSEIDQGALNPNYYCGNGTQRRNIECIDTRSGSTVHDRLCENLNLQKPAEIQKCSVPCPIDCQVGSFSDWSICPQSCETTMQTRERHILVTPMHGGRMCPDLMQQRPCSPNCIKYVYGSGEARCSVDYSRETQCGSALQTKPISCRKNVEFVAPLECLEAAQQGLSVDGLSGSVVDTTNPSYCSLSCPSEPACNFSTWSAPSSCVSSCYDRGNPFIFRTRALIRSFEQHTNRCLAQQYEFTDCPMLEPESNLTSNTSAATTTALVPLSVNSDSECVSFSWQVSEWNSDNTREIQCESGSGVRVSGGCPASLKPSSNQFPCSSKACPDYSSCNSTSGLCQCSDDLEKVAGICLPLSGCLEDNHCLIPNMQCDEGVGQCVCSEGYELQDGVCTSLPTTAPQTTTTEPTSPTTTPLDSTTQSPLVTTGDGDATTEDPVTAAAGLGILEIVLIGTVPLVIVIITVLILICITYRCRVYLEKKDEKTKNRRRTNLSISSPSPTPQTAEEMMIRLSRRGAESASSGFVDDLDNELQKYGMAGKSFIASKHPEDIDEAMFTVPNHPQNPIPVAAPTIPGSNNPLHHHHNHVHMHDVSETNLDGHVIHHHHQQQVLHQQIAPGTPFTMTDNYPDGDFTTDVTYTTDEGSIVTTSVPPSSVGGSPNIMRRGDELPTRLPESPERRSGSRGTENMYVDMQPQPVYASLRRNNHSNYQHHQPQHVQHHQNHQEYQQQEIPLDYRSVKAYERQSRERSEGSHDYLSEPDYARSLSPSSPTARYPPTGFPPHSPTHITGRDNRIATGLDSSILRAAAQMGDGQGQHSQEDQEFQRSYHRSSGGRRSHRRRSGRRRVRHHHHGDGNPHHMTYHPSSRRDDYYYHPDDGHYPRPRMGRHYSEGDHEYNPERGHYYYHSDHDPQNVFTSPSPHPQHYYQASRSVPMTPIMPPSEHTAHLPPSHHHPHSPAMIHGHPPHSPVVVQGHPPHSPIVIQGHPPHSPAMVQGQPHYSHELQQPSIDIQPPTPASSHRGDMTPHSLPPNSPYVQHHPAAMTISQQQLQQQGGSGYPPSPGLYPQSVSTPTLPAHMVPQSTTATTAENHLNPPANGDSYNNYDFPRKVHAHYLRQEQLRQSAEMPETSHYAYPRTVVSSNSTMIVPSPIAATSGAHVTYVSDQQQPISVGNQPQTSTPYSKSAALHSDLSIASSATTCAPQSIVSDSTTNSQPGSPYVVRRQHHPSPLVLHSSSSNSPATSTVYTPRGSAEVQQQHLNLSEGVSSSFDSSMAGREQQYNQSSSFDGSAVQQHAQYQIHHQMNSGGVPLMPTQQQQTVQ